MKAKHTTRREFVNDAALDAKQDTKKAASTPGEGAIAPLAYQFWLERGCPEGCAEEDWFRAERELAQAIERSR